MNEKVEGVLYKDLHDVLGDSHVDDVVALMAMLDNLHVEKEKIYDRSFARRGLIGIWMNMARKYDAIDNMARNERFDFEFIDTVADLALYSIKMLDAMKKIDKPTWDAWVKRVYNKYVGSIGVSKDDKPSLPRA